MKCALIIPAWAPEDIFSSKTAGSQINYWQPLGTLYVAAALKQAGHEVKFYNGAFMTHTEIMLQLEEFQPQFVGLYSTTFGWDKAKKTAAAIREKIADVFLAVGGPYPVALQEKCLTGNKSLEGVEGIAFRAGKEIHKNPPRPLITDLDALPFPARELLGEAGRYIPPPATYKRKPVAVIMTARGCNRKCLYCFQIDKYRKSGIRFRSVENVMAEIEIVLSQGYREIKFIDDTLAGDYNRAMTIAREIKRRGLDFTWFASAVVNQVDKPLLKAFKEAGCWAILFGAESGVQKDLNAIRKGITPAQIKKAVKAAKEVGLTVYTPFLFGIPGQTYADGLKTIEFALEMDPDIANFHAITPFPGTELYDNIEKYGTMSEDLTDYTYQGAAFIPFTMTREEIAELRQLALKKFYSRPKFLWRRVLALRSFNDLMAAWQGIKSLFWLKTEKKLFNRSK
jgi:radical SAM superfamily enzyme YgiQ (UPF0313 family)